MQRATALLPPPLLLWLWLLPRGAWSTLALATQFVVYLQRCGPRRPVAPPPVAPETRPVLSRAQTARLAQTQTQLLQHNTRVAELIESLQAVYGGIEAAAAETPAVPK